MTDLWTRPQYWECSGTVADTVIACGEGNRTQGRTYCSEFCELKDHQCPDYEHCQQCVELAYLEGAAAMAGVIGWGIALREWRSRNAAAALKRYCETGEF